VGVRLVGDGYSRRLPCRSGEPHRGPVSDCCADLAWTSEQAKTLNIDASTHRRSSSWVSVLAVVLRPERC
jgi:hypothetical protein